MKNNYQQKLLDPRWQKKRLEILSRDDFTCQSCFSKVDTLHVHHRIYQAGDPWDTQDIYLISLCDNCHAHETNNLKFSSDSFTKILKSRFFSYEIDAIAEGFAEMPREYPSDVLSEVIKYSFSDETALESMVNMYFDSISNNLEKANG